MLAYLDGEPAAHRVRQVLWNARRKQMTVLFSIINYGESPYVIERALPTRSPSRSPGEAAAPS
jgi:hypothetical protein